MCEFCKKIPRNFTFLRLDNNIFVDEFFFKKGYFSYNLYVVKFNILHPRFEVSQLTSRFSVSHHEEFDVTRVPGRP